MNADKPSVSLITVTQYSRRTCLENLICLINEQIYENICEWVIVEGSKNPADAEANSQLIAIHQKNKMVFPINIVYIPYQTNPSQRHLSDYRNAGNQKCTGDIIVCMDDDDYYPPTRVSHAVFSLSNSTALIAGCSQAYIYFYLHNKFLQFKSFGKNHSTNNCMAYKRAYLESHAHAPGLDKAEESHFTNNYTAPMVQLNPNKCIVVSGHGYNTVDKNWLCEVPSAPGKKYMVNRLTTEVITEQIPFAVLDRMKGIFLKMF
jgi:glycosyltransferase involved in cell wall biosynthesis